MNTTATILLVDDEQVVLDYVGSALQADNYQILTASDGVEALEVLQSQPVDLILADIAMPGMNGYQLYERVCQNPEWVRIPFVILTSRIMDSDIRFGKELGVDDYLVKPIRVEDLLAAVRGKLRHAQRLEGAASQLQPRPVAEGHVLTIDGLQIDPTQHRVWLDERELHLSAKEFVLLECLAQQQGRVVSPQELVQVSHGYDTDATEAGALIRPLILSLRRKLGFSVDEVDEVGSIANVRGVGYRLVVPE